MRFSAFLLLLLSVHMAAAQTDVEVTGSGKIGMAHDGDEATATPG